MRKLFHWNKKMGSSLVTLVLLLGLSTSIILSAPREDAPDGPCGTETLGGTIVSGGCGCCGEDWAKIRECICLIKSIVQETYNYLTTTIESKLDHIHISISDHHESVESKLDKLIPIAETINDYLHTTIESKLDKIGDDVIDIYNYLSETIESKLDKISIDVIDIYNYLSETIESKLDVISDDKIGDLDVTIDCTTLPSTLDGINGTQETLFWWMKAIYANLNLNSCP